MRWTRALGSDTDDAVRAFQTLLGLSVDGVVGDRVERSGQRVSAAPDQHAAAQDLFAAWGAHNHNQAGRERHARRGQQIFTHTFSSGDGWSFEGGQGDLGHVT